MRRWPKLPLARHHVDLGMLLFFWSLLLLVGSLWWWLPLRPTYQWQTPWPICGAWVSDSGRTLIAFHDGQPSTVWEVASSKFRASLPFHKGSTNTTTWWMSQDDRVVAYTSSDGTKPCLRVHDIAAGRQRFMVRNCAGEVWGLLADADTLLLSDGTLVSLRTGEAIPCPAELAALLANKWRIQDWNPQRLLLVQWEEGDDYSVAVWDWPSRNFVLPPQAVTASCGLIHFVVKLDPSGSRLALVSGRAAEIWNLDGEKKTTTWAELGKWKVPGQFSPDGNRLIVCTAKYIYNVETPSEKEEVWDITHEPPRLLGTVFGSMGFSADGRWIVAPAKGTRWDTTSLPSLQQESCQFQFDPSTNPNFSADGRFLVGPITYHSNLSNWLPAWLVGKQEPQHRLQIVDTAAKPATATLIPLRKESFDPQFWLISLESGPQLLTVQRQRLIQVWNFPPRRAVLVDYGLPVLFGLLVLAVSRQAYRLFKPRHAQGRLLNCASVGN